MSPRETHAVTGSFGYSGRYITQQLLLNGRKVITLTNSPRRKNPFGDKVAAYPFDFDHPDRLAKSLEGTSVLYNTYWVRFNHPMFTHSSAVANTKTLFNAAKQAGVERVVHVSITNPSLSSPLEYFRGKAELEEALKDSGLSYAILRPAVIFGPEDILINNIAWMLRRFPVFGIFGDGNYRLQPIYVDDLAALAVEQGDRRENVLVNAIGPETFTYRELVATIGTIIGKRRPMVRVPYSVGYWVGRAVGKFVGDVVITREEIEGLVAGLLYVDAAPAGATKFTDWARQNAGVLGVRYASELARRKDRERAYSEIGKQP
jgi:NADH dehydrogenase